MMAEERTANGEGHLREVGQRVDDEVVIQRVGVETRLGVQPRSDWIATN